MKNFMVIDGAQNSRHMVFAVDDGLFEIAFPNGEDVAFLDEVSQRAITLGWDEIEFFNKLYAHEQDKKQIVGLHGILHSTSSYCKKEYFPSRREVDVVKDGTILSR